jgi:hypothetical protein
MHFDLAFEPAFDLSFSPLPRSALATAPTGTFRNVN